VADEERPFEDVRETPDGFSIPELKWRELLFVGALRREGDGFVRDPSRLLPAFRIPDLFPEGVLFVATSDHGRVHVRRRG
jgi:hypothetical protein